MITTPAEKRERGRGGNYKTGEFLFPRRAWKRGLCSNAKLFLGRR